MYHRCLSFPLSSLCVVCMILAVIQILASADAKSDEFIECSSTIWCGNLQNIGYPFWGVNRPDYCGLGTDYQLTCESNTTLEITISGMTYQVLQVDNSARAFTIARTDYTSDICPQYLYNSSVTSISFTYFNDTLPRNLTLYYNCTTSLASLPSNGQFMWKFDGRYGMINYFSTRDVADTHGAALDCTTSVVLPVYLLAVQTLETTPTASNVLAAISGGFGLQWPDDNGKCQQCIDSGGQCGRNGTTNFACYFPSRFHPSSCSSVSRSGLNSRLLTILIAIALPLGDILFIGIIVTCCLKFGCIKWQRVILSEERDENHCDIEAFIRNHGSLSPRRYEYSALKKMTDKFSEKLGEGGYGSVYKGNLPDGRPVAVKILRGSTGNGEEFINEVASISRTAHVNVVTLLGFCYEKNRRAQVYEFMPNGSLDRFVTAKGTSETSCPLEWEVSYQIALGVARGLEYLHRGCNTRIVHFDIKPQNILLDQDFMPKISDFGLAKFCRGKESIVSMLGARGTMGYIAPEVFCRNFGGVSHKSDVYSYGMLVLDMVCGRDHSDIGASHSNDEYFPDWIYTCLELGKELTSHGAKSEEEEEIARKMIIVSLWCIQTHPSDRPSIKKVIEMLEGSSQVLQIPPKPFLTSPARSPQIYLTSSSGEEKTILETGTNQNHAEGSSHSVIL